MASYTTQSCGFGACSSCDAIYPPDAPPPPPQPLVPGSTVAVDVSGAVQPAYGPTGGRWWLWLAIGLGFGYLATKK